MPGLNNNRMGTNEDYQTLLPFDDKDLENILRAYRESLEDQSGDIPEGLSLANYF